uniref:Uncharacterized protein n=1 Tax=Tanacetum cinerariifolium TaxID=118510 RepID=A0A6L2J7W8_TANCI|nr:hypothetical protein [Tanacetum cinerariifolium]
MTALSEVVTSIARSPLKDILYKRFLRSDITSKESTLQLVYDVLRLIPFYKAFLVTADVPEIYMEEFWATATVHHHSIRFKMETRNELLILNILGRCCICVQDFLIRHLMNSHLKRKFWHSLDILDTYGDTVTLKRRCDDADKDEEPSIGSDWGPRDEEKEKSQSQQALQRRRRPRPLASLLKGLNLIKRLQASLHQQRSQCRQLKIWKSPHIKSLKQVLLMINLSQKLLRILNDLQLGVASYQKKLNLTKPDTYRSDLKRKEAYTAYSNPRGFIYQNKDKQNRLMRINELHKFSDGMLNDVRTALDDRLKGIRVKYLPQAIWRKSDKERAAAMIQAIDK